MTSTLESKDGLQSTIEVLKEVAEKFNMFEHEYKNTKSIEKLRERAQLLVELPDRIISTLEGVDQEIRQRILDNVKAFSAQAQRALDGGEKYELFELLALLTPKGSEIGDKNRLEELIDSL